MFWTVAIVIHVGFYFTLLFENWVCFLFRWKSGEKDHNLVGLLEGATPTFTKPFKWATRLKVISPLPPPPFSPHEDEDRPSFYNAWVKK
jgi:hypothetical protein